MDTIISDLKGKRIAVEMGALGRYILTRALEKNGLHLTDVKIKHALITEHASLFRDSLVDAVVTFEPFRTELLNQGAIELFSSREIPGEIMDVLIGNERFLKENKGEIYRLTDIWFSVLRSFPDSSVIATLAERQGVTTEEVVAAFDESTFPSKDESKILLRDKEKLHQKLKKITIILQIDHVINLENLITDAYLGE